MTVLLTAMLGLRVESKGTPKPFVAVFANPGTEKLAGWDRVHPDLFFVSGDWEKLDEFLDKAKKGAGSRPLVIDVECHGSPITGMLVIEYSAFGQSMDDTASVGYVIKHIDSKLGNKKNLEVCLESCYSGVCWSRTLVNKAEIESEDFHVSSFDKPVRFPVYGVGQTLNWNCLVFMEYHSKVRPYFHDLREYTGQDVQPIMDKEIENKMIDLFRYLYIFYN